MEWISVKDRLPEEGKRVLNVRQIGLNHLEYEVDYIIFLEYNPETPYIWSRELDDNFAKVSHWAEIPEFNPTSHCN
jgi:Protein of unknown function (DUF551)